MPAEPIDGLGREMKQALRYAVEFHSRWPVSTACFRFHGSMGHHRRLRRSRCASRVFRRIRSVIPSRGLLRVILFCVALGLFACEQPYRIGEYVLVEWEDGQPPYPAYIVAQKSKTRFRVHYDGYATRWDEDVTLDRIKGRVTGHVFRPPPPKKVQRAQGIAPARKESSAQGSASAAPVGQYQVGDRVKVRWRGTVYPATVVGVVGQDRYLIHYDGHESAWDEIVNANRIVSTR